LRASQFEVIASEFGNDADLDIAKIGFDGLVVGSSAATPWRTLPKRSTSQKASKPNERIDSLPLDSEARNLLLAVLVGTLDRHGRQAIEFSLIKDGARLGEPGLRDADAVVPGQGAIPSESSTGSSNCPPPRVERRFGQKLRSAGGIAPRPAAAPCMRPTRKPRREREL